MKPQGLLGAEEDCGMLGLLVPSPQSEAVTHELEELSLQPSNNLPPLNERKNVLQLRLLQRRTREQLVDQGIMPPLKSPAAFHEQIRSLERARTENFLKHKIRSRPERCELVRMHILKETGAEPSLQATQMKLKRARLADDLNEKLAQRPGPMELVEKNILPVEPSVKEAIIVNYPKALDAYGFDEDSGDALSPEQPASHESQAAAPSPGEPRALETPCPPPLPTITNNHTILQPFPVVTQATADFLKALSTNEPPVSRPAPAHQPVTTVASQKPGPTLVKQSQPRQPGERNRSKKGKEPKPRVKKLKYHQYVPQDQKQEASEAPMDSSYAKILHQQQLFLQLQILHQQQQQHYNYHTILPAPLKPVAEGQSSAVNGLPTSTVVSLPPAVTVPPPTPVRPNSLSNRKPGQLPPNLEDMKVAELKLELKLRSLPVSGTKTDLIERLKPYQESPSTPALTPGPNTLPSSVPMEVSSSLAPESMSSTPPVSPIPTDLSTFRDNRGVSELFCGPQTVSPGRAGVGMSPLRPGVPEEKDPRLHEKERQIEELMRELEQEQRLVEELKMQLEVEKTQPLLGPSTDPVPMIQTSNKVKLEDRVLPNCSAMVTSIMAPQTHPHSLPTVVKLEDVLSNSQPPHQPYLTPTLPQFFISHQGAVSQVVGQPGTQTLLAAQDGTTQILMPVLQATISNQAPGLIQASVPQLHTTKMETRQSSTQQQILNHNHMLQTFTACNGPGSGMVENQTGPDMHPQCFLRSSPDNRLSPRGVSPNHTLSNGPVNKSPSPSQPTFIFQHSSLVTQPPMTREPPCYEDAVIQTRNLKQANNFSQVSTATSQQMDDLFDILIQSGEITPFIQQPDLLSLSAKTVPITANITTLPVNTALSRPPPQIQVAPPPISPVDPLHLPSLATMTSDKQLEAFLEGTLNDPSPTTDPRTLGLIEELQSQLLDQPYSPMDTSELSFCDSTSPPSSLNMGMSDTALDNMEWLDLTMPPGPAGGLTPLGIPSDFLDTHDLQLHWD
ncbi:myocardin-related transcription factor B isoform X1 [Salmo trutta]|uniref:Myocardin related transcription factor Ba n=1 Tax=Salmo trutta TaxID=8032 RepID=A0A673WUY7_SALTR|nr:myocardin-related transcription factor B-like isoform X1 [Salmo trutta]XP_029553765.1 myocardin-related transcription factor B-like isoform X1 [Salmo trutta]XP_029553767.1 myocardin-related transcription factor B-like isoform X1 [Salmo trutta]XP_029553768.1 myocardin-related transcription factor B-like isoform X1 [Salmo trutta]